MADKTILIADDEEGLRMLFGDICEDRGYKTVRARDGVDGFAEYEQLCRQGARIALVVTDVLMPRMNGIEMYKRIHEQTPDVPVLMLSGFTNGLEIPAEILQQGRFMEKPVHLADFGAKLDEIVGKA